MPGILFSRNSWVISAAIPTVAAPGSGLDQQGQAEQPLNPVVPVHPPPIFSKTQYFSALGHLMLGTGMRPSEALGLRAADYDAARGRIVVRGGKTAAARRSIRLIGRGAGIVQELASSRRGYLFPVKQTVRERS